MNEKNTNEMKEFMEEVYKTDLKTLKHAEHDIVESLKLYRFITITVLAAARAPFHILYICCGIAAIIAGIITIISEVVNNVPIINGNFTITLVLAIVAVSAYVIERITNKFMKYNMEYVADKIIAEGLKTTVVYPFLSKEELKDLHEKIKKYHTTDEDAINALNIMRKVVKEAEEKDGNSN